MTFPTYRPPHWCYYRRLQGSSNRTDTTMEWIERCRCGRLVKGVMEVVNGTPVTVKHWFDREGNLERKTGFKLKSESSDKPVNSSPNPRNPEPKRP